MILPACRMFPLTLIALASVVIQPGCSGNGPQATETNASKLVPVKVISVTEEEIQKKTTQPASVHAYFRAEIQARVTGYVKEVRADIGDVVEAGAVLATIDVPEMDKRREIVQARVVRSESEEQRAEAGVRLAEANVTSAEAKLSQTESKLDRAKAALKAAEAEFNRTKDLVERRSLEPRMLDETKKKYDVERANTQAAISAIESSKAGVLVARAELTSAEADYQAAKAETEIAKRQFEELDVLISYATLKAPFSGIVTQRTLDLGDLVREHNDRQPGKALFVVSQVDTLRIQVPVPETEAAHVSRGDSLSLSFPSFSAEESLTATITRVAGELDPHTRTMLVEAEIPNAQGKLLPGMFGQASITLNAKVATNMLPARAVRFDEAGQAYVYTVGDDETVSVVPVDTGIDTGNHIEVKNGVTPGQRVIDAHLKRFTDGQKVTLIAP